MTLTLIGLHGFTLNGAVMRTTLSPIVERLPNGVTVECPDGTLPCSDGSVMRMQQLFGGTLTPPHRCWFDASDDGREYRGFDQTKDALNQLIESRSEPVGLIGFSQGAIAVASLAALSMHQRFAQLAFVVLVAGRVPRADGIAALFETPIAVPSLHVWGQRDQLAMQSAPALVEHFEPATRSTAEWRGPHTIPTRGSAADAIVQFVTDHA